VLTGEIRGRSLHSPAVDAPDRLAVLKALGDNTRYAIYLELARKPSPLSTAEIADSLGLHPNTVRPHLERMREVGLLEVAADTRGSVGRPQHLYRLAADAPSLGLEPPTFPMLARMLLRVAQVSRVDVADVVDVGREQGAADAARAARRQRSCVAALSARLAELGFDPATVEDDEVATIAFTHCPFRELAEAAPELVCNLHRGLVEGFVDEHGGADVRDFNTLVDRTPCQVELAITGTDR
jgi:predicted ArsR family transcriptional regulator